MFNNLYEMKWKNLRTRHDTSALNFLFSNRCQLAAAVINPQIASGAPGTWNETNYALEVAAGNKDRFIQQAKILMQARLYQGEYDVLSDLQIGGNVDYSSQQGAANQANYSWQYDGVNINRTSDVISSAYSKGAALILPATLFAGMYWNDGLNKSGSVNSGETEVGSLGTIADPFGSGAVADISVYTKRADTSANTSGGSPQDVVDQYEVTLTMAYALPPLSVAGDSVVHLVAQV
jgi:hypothetical protein